MDHVKREKAKTSINTKLGFAFLMALLIPALLISFVSYNAAKNEIETQIQSSAFQSVSTVDEFINKHKVFYRDMLCLITTYFAKIHFV